jgi:hypothetical protein
MSSAVLLAVDREHLLSALDGGLGTRHRAVSFGTDFWTEDSRENPESFPSPVPAYIYAVMRGAAAAVPYATWQGRFLGYRRAEDFRPGELDRTRPPTTIARRNPRLPLDQQETDWAGYMMIDDLHELETGHWIALQKFRIRGKAYAGTVVRHPLVVEEPTR